MTVDSSGRAWKFLSDNKKRLNLAFDFQLIQKIRIILMALSFIFITSDFVRTVSYKIMGDRSMMTSKALSVIFRHYNCEDKEQNE